MLIEFYGTECPHCNDMKPLVAKLEKEADIKLESLETWHNDVNEKKRQEMDQGLCGGVPFFFNTENKSYICGAVPYEELRRWATNK